MNKKFIGPKMFMLYYDCLGHPVSTIIRIIIENSYKIQRKRIEAKEYSMFFGGLKTLKTILFIDKLQRKSSQQIRKITMYINRQCQIRK